MMEKWILQVMSNCRALVPGHQFSDDDAYNDYYDNVHIPDVMKALPEMKTARRYVNPDISTLNTGKYMALYEIETDDINAFMGRLLENNRKLEKQGRISPLLQAMSMSVFKQISCREQGK